METAMQELIEWGKKLNAGYIHIDLFNAKATELLAKEKEQIKKAHEAGTKNGIGTGEFHFPETYYTQTYTTKK